jgi:hypothetical protein
MRIWLDDERPMPADYDLHVRTVEEAIAVLEKGDVSEISLDNDLGTGLREGYDVAKWIEEAAFKHSQGEGGIPFTRVHIHTQNPAAKQKMKLALRNAHRYWRNLQ